MVHQYILFGLVCLILIMVIYWFFIYKSDRAKSARSEKYYQESIGNFDDNARQALRELGQINNPAAQDYFRRGNIIEYNILEDNIQQRVGEQPQNRELRRVAIGEIARDYTQALFELRPAEEFNIDFMLHRIEDFNERALLDNDDIGDLWVLHETIDDLAPVVRQDVIEDRVNKAVAGAETREAAVDNYFDDAIQYKSDAQNVHDSKVNVDLRNTFKILQEANPLINPRKSIAECRQFIAQNFTGEKAANAGRILDMIAEGNHISTFGSSEDRIFAATWERCKDPLNRENSDLMKEAVVNSLADSIEGGAPVCINGRCGRVLNSLVTLDHDHKISERGALTYEAYKNQIFQETQNIIKNEITRAKDSLDDNMRAVGESYEGKNVKTDDAMEQQFRDAVKAEIDQNLTRYNEKFTAAELENIRRECYAGVDI